MSFDFPFKKGSGIPLLTANLSPQCLSLLHAMVAYDPDERISAHQALQHPYFREQRAAEKQAWGGHRKAAVPERPVAPEQLSDKWPVSKEGSKQVRTGGRQEGGPAGAAPSGGLCLRVPPRGSAGSALSALPASAAWAGQTGPWGVPQDATCAPRPTPAGAQRG